MTREKAIEVLELEWHNHEAGSLVESAIDMAISALREQETLTQSQNSLTQWISFDERFPDDSFLEKAIIVCIKNRWNEQRIDTVHWHGNEQRLNAAWFWGDVTHWMPLPEPPKEEV